MVRLWSDGYFSASISMNALTSYWSFHVYRRTQIVASKGFFTTFSDALNALLNEYPNMKEVGDE